MRFAAARLPLTERMQTVKEEIPLQLIRDHCARAYKCDSGSSSSRESSDISEVELKQL